MCELADKTVLKTSPTALKWPDYREETGLEREDCGHSLPSILEPFGMGVGFHEGSFHDSLSCRAPCGGLGDLAVMLNAGATW